MEEELLSFQKNKPHLSAVLLGFQKKKIERTLLSFVEDFSLQNSTALQPRHFEWSFGKKSPALEITGHDGRPLFRRLGIRPLARI